MISMASQIASVPNVYTNFCSGADQKKTSKLRATRICKGNSPMTGEFPAQRASNAENVSIWWRHHALLTMYTVRVLSCFKWVDITSSVACAYCALVTVHQRCKLRINTSQNKNFIHDMMTSSNGNIFRATGPLCGEFTGHRWIPRTKASDAKLWCFLWSALE